MKKLGTEHVLDEITAQARAASYLNPDADTVFEIGGQDSKYISVKHSQVVDFEMNKVCAREPVSFIEEQAGRLGIPLAGWAHGTGGRASGGTGRALYRVVWSLDFIRNRGGAGKGRSLCRA